MSNDPRVAIVTGASRGIGRATALRLAEDFGALALVARGEDELEAAARIIRRGSTRAYPIAVDLTHPAAAEIVVDRTLAQFGRVDTLVNVAGSVSQSDLFELGDADWAESFALKFDAARRLAIRAWSALERNAGSIVFMSGSSALNPKPAFAAVGTINAAILALAKAFAERGSGCGVQVNSVLPGPVMTDRRRSMLEKFGAARNLGFDDAVASFAREAGISRYGTPEDVAALIAFLVSPSARWMTGTAVRMDGGEIKAV